MKHQAEDRISNIPADQRAVEFDFAVRAPLRTHIARCINSGWTAEELALAFSEMAEELSGADGAAITRS